MAGITLNTNGDMKFWKSQSPNELRAQLKLRNIPINTYAFLKKKELIDFVRDLINTNKW